MQESEFSQNSNRSGLPTFGRAGKGITTQEIPHPVSQVSMKHTSECNEHWSVRGQHDPVSTNEHSYTCIIIV